MSSFKDLSGKKFGKLTVIERCGTYKSGSTTRAVWLCVCECGNEVRPWSAPLTSGTATRCKECAYAERPQSTKRYTAVERLFRLKVVDGSERRGIPVNMTAEEYYDIAKLDCYYCGEPPKQFDIYRGKFSKKETLLVNGVDRVDSSGSYEVPNCVPCCKHCNTSKMEESQSDFYKRIERIYIKRVKDK